MKANDDNDLDLSVYLEPSLESDMDLQIQQQQPVIICVSNCGRPAQ